MTRSNGEGNSTAQFSRDKLFFFMKQPFIEKIALLLVK